MAFNRSRFSRSRRTFGGFRRPPGKLIWTSASTPLVLTTAAANNPVALLTPSQWVTNAAAGGFEHAKILKLVLIPVEPNTTAFPVNQQMAQVIALSVDDISSNVVNPNTALGYQLTQPFKTLVWSYTGTAANVAVNSQLQNNPTGSFSFRVNRKIRSDQNLWAYLGPTPSASFNLTQPMISRCLLRLA